MLRDPNKILSWKKFSALTRSSSRPMLAKLGDFPNSILVTGCQRSGTTALTRLIRSSDQIAHFQFSKDDERDGALILAGIASHKPMAKRYCFQTTYLNERYTECFSAPKEHKVIWVLRNPFSVIYSLLHNWWDFGLNEVFMGCGTDLLSKHEKKLYKILGKYGISQLHKACYAYSGKTRQIYDLYEKLGEKNFFMIEYDEMILQKQTILPKIFSFIGLPYHEQYADSLHNNSITIKNKLTRKEEAEITKLCAPSYNNALNFLHKNF